MFLQQMNASDLYVALCNDLSSVLDSGCLSCYLFLQTRKVVSSIAFAIGLAPCFSHGNRARGTHAR